MQVCPVGRDLVKTASRRQGPHNPEVESNHCSVRRPSRIVRLISRGDEFVSFGTIAFCQKQVVSVGVNDPLPIGRPGCGLPSGFSQSARGAAEHRHFPKRSTECGLADLVRHEQVCPVGRNRKQ